MTENNPKTHYPSSGGIPSPSDDGPKKLPGKQKMHFNPPEKEIPDAATLRDQWRYAIRQYSKWYSHAWGTAILAGTAFFALGWFIKGENPIPSFNSNKDKDKDNHNSHPWCHVPFTSFQVTPFDLNYFFSLSPNVSCLFLLVKGFEPTTSSLFNLQVNLITPIEISLLIFVSIFQF